LVRIFCRPIFLLLQTQATPSCQNAQIQRNVYEMYSTLPCSLCEISVKQQCKTDKDLNNNDVQSVIKKKTRIIVKNAHHRAHRCTANLTSGMKISNAQCATLAEASVSTRCECETLAWCHQTPLFLLFLGLMCIYPLTPPPTHIPLSFSLPRFPPLLSGDTFSTPAFSAPPIPRPIRLRRK